MVVALAFVVTEFVFLSWLFHLDDGADARDRAQARAAVALDVWEPGAPTAPVAEAVRSLSGSGIADADALDAALTDWTSGGSASALTALNEAVGTAGTEVRAEQTRVDREVTAVFVGLLVLVSAGWYLYFRRLLRRHRSVERELTERRTVQSGEQRLLALVQNSTDVVAVLEPDATATFLSPSVGHVLGHEPEDLLGTALLELVAEPDRQSLREQLLTRRAGVHPVHLRVRHHDGRELVMDGTLQNLCDEPSVQGWVLTVRDATERQRLQDDLTRQAFHDSLTGLANRQLFSDRLEHALSRRSSGPPRPLAVLFLDLDDFKNVNDSLGHATGDALLVAVAGRIRSTVRPGDTAARLGGDEFAVLLEDADQTTASQIGHRLLAALHEPVELDGVSHLVHASVGLAEAVPGQEDAAETMRNADVAMYMAKERGKGGLAVYDSVWHQRALASLSLRQELERAVERDQLVLHYQPTVDLRTGEVTGFEALIRWEHPERGLVPPLDFIPLAEQSGLIVPIGDWVLRTATRDVASLDDGAHRPTVAVNVAAKQLAHPGFVASVQEALAESGLEPQRLVLEITESALLDDLDVGVSALAGLRAQGVRVAIDDFGTGYSSLSHLAQLPVDVLKVDKSFIDRLRQDEDDALVSAILAMSRGLRLTSVAEGVEDLAQAAWLQAAECTLGQGYLWSRPVDLATARRLLAEPVGVPVPLSGLAQAG